jgi:hypothetical protein
MPSDKTHLVRRSRWPLILVLSIGGGMTALVAAFLTVNSAMDAVSNEQGELRVSIFGIDLHTERGPWQPLEKKMFVYGWILIGGYVALGMLVGGGIGVGIVMGVSQWRRR